MNQRQLVLIVALLAVMMLFALILFARFSGLASLSTQKGFYGAVWHPDGRQIYFFERESRGIIIGPGWEHFTPPAQVYMLADEISLIRYQPATGHEQRLHSFDVEPHLGRWASRYHSRIFGWLSTVIDPTATGVEFSVGLTIPNVPTSQSWIYQATLIGDVVTPVNWVADHFGGRGMSDAVLLDGEELMVIRNAESYGTAILKVRADQSYDILKSTDGFSVDMVEDRKLREQSRRESIEKTRRFIRVREELIQRFHDEGLPDAEAFLRATDEMEEIGLLSRSPRIIASRLTVKPDDEPVFVIPDEYYQVGMFQDIAEAIRSPGTEVKASTGDHLKYYNDDVGIRLKAYRRENDSFVVETGGAYFRLSRH